MHRLAVLVLIALALAGCRRLDPLAPEPGPLSWEPRGASIPLETLVAGTDGRLAGLVLRDRRLLVVSDDGGRTWSTPWEPPAPFDSLAAVLAAGEDGVLYAVASTPLNPATGLRGHVVYRLTDGGARPERLPMLWSVASVSALRAEGDVVYLGTQGQGEQGLHRSDDGGRTWRPTAVRTQRSGGLLAPALAASGPRAAAQVLDGTTLSDLYLSGDAGRSWRLAARPRSPIRRLTFSPDGRLYAAVDDPGTDGVYRSEGDGGWQRLPLVIDGQRLYDLLAPRPGFLYLAAGSDGVYRSADAGASWTRANDGLPGTNTLVNQPVLMLVQGAEGHLYAVTPAALYRSTEPI